MTLLSSQRKAKGNVVEYFVQDLNVSFDTKGYFSDSLFEFRERQERILTKEMLKAEIVRSRKIKKNARQFKDSIAQCEHTLENLGLDIKKIQEDGQLMRHRPTNLSVSGSLDALENCQRKVSVIKSCSVPTDEADLKDTLKELKRVFHHARQCVKQVSE